MSYSPTLGRFLEQDPEGYTDSLNLYQPYRSNPLAFVDPMGTDSIPTTQPTSGPTSQPHDPKTCPTCNSSDPNKDKADAIVVDEKAKNATNCIGWAMNDNSQTFMASLGLGMKAFDELLKPKDLYIISDAVKKQLEDRYGGKRLQNPNDDCPCGTHKIAVYYRDYGALGGRDIHMITQHPDGSWSGKPSFDKPVRPQTPEDVQKDKGSGRPWGGEGNVHLLGYYCVKGPPRCKQ